MAFTPKPPVIRPWNPWVEEWDAYERELMKQLEAYCDVVEREYQAEQVVPNFAEILGILTPREEQIIRMRLGICGRGGPMTLEEVGSEFAVRRERIRQIQNRAMRKLSASGGRLSGEAENRV